MYPLPPMPRGCEILAQRFDDSLILTWREFTEQGWAIFMWLYYGGLLLVWTVLGVSFVVVVVRKETYAAFVLLPVWCFAWLYLASLMRLFTGIRTTESVIMTPTELTYDPGPSHFLMILANEPFAFYSHNPFTPLREFFTRQRIPIRCLKIGAQFQLLGEQLFLRTAQGNFEIGHELTQEDRQWLHAVLVQWLNANDGVKKEAER